MTRLMLVIVPSPAIGHLVSTIKFAKQLIGRDNRFSATILLMRAHFAPDVDAYSQLLVASASHSRIHFINLPEINPPPLRTALASPENFISVYTDSYKSHVKAAIVGHVLSNKDSISLVGLVFDLLTTSMIDVADELGVPSYLFFTSPAAFLGFMLYLPTRHDQVCTEFRTTDSDSLVVPSYANPIPSGVVPSFLFNKEGGYSSMQNHARRFREAKGIIVNTFSELESHAVCSFSGIGDTPPIYTVGPVIDLIEEGDYGSGREIMKWLDDQPAGSVVLLCFGSMGSFDETQLKEIAIGLERSEQRFLWSIREAPPKDVVGMPRDYADHRHILPEKFNEAKGRICGRIRQVAVLGHKAIGAFVSHCGWNSILESIWYGVPIVAWPLYAEQQLNAFQLVRELGLAVEMKLEYRMGDDNIVTADTIAKAVECVMGSDGHGVRKRVKQMSEMARNAVLEGGSSFTALGRLIDAMSNILPI